MKGIIILGFNVNNEVYIYTQYPSNIAESLNVKASDLMNIYTLHRMKENEPNFFQMEIKDFCVASFFTGFSFKRYVGTPDYTITVFLSEDEVNEDVLPKDFEGLLRRIAYEVLPKMNDLNDSAFNELFKEYYLRLKNGDLEPYWEEQIEEEESETTTIYAEEIEASSEEIIGEVDAGEYDDSELKVEVVSQPEDRISINHYDELEKDVLVEEIKDLRVLLKEKSEKIRELTKRITEQLSNKSELEEWQLKYEELTEKNQLLRKNLNKLTEMTFQQKEEIEKQEHKISELKIDLEEKETYINELNNKLDIYKKELKQLKKFKEETENYLQEIERLKQDNERYLDSIASLKFKLRELRNRKSSEIDAQHNLKEEIIDLKKELKVLRREKDHYKNIIKEKNLL